MARSLAKATRGKQDLAVTDLCYLAGVVDSDGCISIDKTTAGFQGTKSPRYVLSIKIVNTSEELMQWLIEKVGGNYRSRRKVSDAHKTTYTWWFCNARASWLLDLIEPHLVVKKKQARIGIQLIEGWVTKQSGPGTRTPPEEVERREGFFQQMKVLNQTGPCSRND